MPLSIASMRSHCTEPEWQARVDLAACYRLVDLYGMSDMMANHISSHVPGEPGAFLINAYGMMYEERGGPIRLNTNRATISGTLRVERGTGLSTAAGGRRLR